MDDHVTIASVVEDGVRYDLVVRKIDLSSLAGGGANSVVQEPKATATKVQDED